MLNLTDTEKRDIVRYIEEGNEIWVIDENCP